MSRKINKLRAENNQVLTFIKNWQIKNDYKKENLTEYNAKFNTDFNEFLHNSSISDETKKQYLKI